MLVSNEFGQDVHKFAYGTVVLFFFMHQRLDEDLRTEFFVCEPFFNESLSYRFDCRLFLFGNYRPFTSLLTKLVYSIGLLFGIVC